MVLTLYFRYYYELLLLIQNCIDTHHRNESGFTGLELACTDKYTDLIELLTDKLNRVCIVCNKPTRDNCPLYDMRYYSSECLLIHWKT
jgi:hypothetical protein